MKSIYLRFFKEVEEPYLAQFQTPKLKTRDHRFSNGGLFAKSDPPLRAQVTISLSETPRIRDH